MELSSKYQEETYVAELERLKEMEIRRRYERKGKEEESETRKDGRKKQTDRK